MPPGARAFRSIMPDPSTRRQLLLGAIGTLAACAAPRTTAQVDAAGGRPASPAHLDDLEAKVGGRVGVFAVDTGSGRQLAHRADERFPMCSTFKWALAAAVLARVDRESCRSTISSPTARAICSTTPRSRASTSARDR